MAEVQEGPRLLRLMHAAPTVSRATLVSGNTKAWWRGVASSGTIPFVVRVTKEDGDGVGGFSIRSGLRTVVLRYGLLRAPRRRARRRYTTWHGRHRGGYEQFERSSGRGPGRRNRL